MYWTFPNFCPSLANLNRFYCLTAPLALFVIGIWSGQPLKMFVVFWRLWWNKLNCFQCLRNWGMEVLDRCLLYGEEDETNPYLFLNCIYSKKLWNSFASRTMDAVASHNGRLIRNHDIRIGDLIKGVEKFQRQGLCWGLQWLAIATLCRICGLSRIVDSRRASGIM